MKVVGKKILYSLFLLFLTGGLIFPLGSVTAQDFEGTCDPPPFSREKGSFVTTNAIGETIWRVDVNSGCQYSDHHISLDVDAEPANISNARIKLSTYDVDYNDPQGCVGGPEVDYLYVNSNKVGQLTGANNSWSINNFNLSSSYLVKGTNNIYIDTDAPNTGCWCVGVGYVEIIGRVGFQVTGHTPAINEKNVPFKTGNNSVTIDFSYEVKAATVTDKTIIVDYRNQSGSWTQVPGTYTLTTKTKVTFKPNGDLKDGIRYRVRVLAGGSGVLSKDDAQLANAVTWYFWTILDLDGQTSAVYKPNTTKDKIQIAWFNVSRDKNLVPKKDEVVRIYALWDPKSDVFDADEVSSFTANVTLDINGTKKSKNNQVIKRPDKYTANEKKLAKNTLNFYQKTTTGNKETYKVTIEPVPQKAPSTKYEKTADATVSAKSPKIKFNYWACEMAGWYNGVVAADLTAAKATLTGGVTFTQQIFPVIKVEATDKGTVARGNTGFNMQYSQTKHSAWWGGNCRFVKSPPASAVEIEEIRHVMTHLATLKPGAHKFIAGLAPSDALPGATGCRWNHVILLSHSQFNEGTVAHEIGHEYTLNHNNSNNTIEGFRVATKANKSFTEGNREYASIAPLMHETKHPTNERWIRPDQYQTLLGQVMVSTVSGINALTGDYLIVQGYTDENNNIIATNPLYRVTQPYVPLPSGTGYAIELFSGENGGGTQLAAYDFGIDDITIVLPDGTMPTFSSQMFAFGIPWDDETMSVVLTGPNNTVTINKSSGGSQSPSVGFIYPTQGDTIGGITTLMWSGSDDGSTIYYRVEYSPDGAEWIPVSNQLTDVSSYNLNTVYLPIGTSSRLALIAYDGFNSTRTEIGINVNNDVQVKLTNPLDGAIGVSEGSIISAGFVADLDPATVTTDTVHAAAGGTPVIGSVAYDDATKVISFTPQNALPSNTIVQVALSGGASGIRDINGNILSSDYIWSFTVGKTSDNPLIANVSPENGVTDVPLNALISVEFDSDMNSSTITSASFLLEDSNGSAVTGAVGYNAASKSAVFIPDANLTGDMTYTATVTTDMQDLDGAALEQNHSWSFLTGSSLSTGVRITGIVSDQAVDTNNDGYYDELGVRFGLEVFTAGNYNLNCQLLDSYQEDIAWASTTGYYDPGVYLLDVVFNGEDIGGHGVDGPYLVTNASVYNQSDSSIEDSYTQTYETYPYKADQFQTVIRLTGIPEISVGVDSTNEDVINLENYASHDTYLPSELTYSLLINSELNAGVQIDAQNNLDVMPEEGFSGFTELTIEVKDTNGKRALDRIRVNVNQAYKFADVGWYLVCPGNIPPDTAIDQVMAPLAGSYQSVWAYKNGAWQYYSPSSPGFSDLDKIEHGYGYWFAMTQPSFFHIVGEPLAKDPIDLVQGWNLVAFNYNGPMAIGDAMSSLAGQYLSVWAYINHQWAVYDPNNPALSDLTTLEPGYGIWINSLAELTWNLP